MENNIRSEFETIEITNPTKSDFTVAFNGQRYTIGAGEKRQYPFHLAYHIAKHLSTEILNEEVRKLISKSKENPYAPEVGQLIIFDNPKRRIALYDILGSKMEVEQCVAAFPFKGFIGEMSDYDDYVTNKTQKSSAKKEA